MLDTSLVQSVVESNMTGPGLSLANIMGSTDGVSYVPGSYTVNAASPAMVITLTQATLVEGIFLTV